ncbi:glycogen debranching protein GlgX [Providencia manganoxydans]|uniref:glycogen debranching protein GlgX n=1 Tax=Providencia manganoxydans TaxID=2923283 RepID=UPI0034E406C5
MANVNFKLSVGHSTPLGCVADKNGVNFALYSEKAERVELCLFSQQGEEIRYDLIRDDKHIWHGYLLGATAGLHYGYRVHGLWQPEQGLRFNPNKLLIDPYSRAVSSKVQDVHLFIDGIDSRDVIDNGSIAPKSIVTQDNYDWGDDELLNTPWSQTIIYEAHVRGLTQLHPDIPQEIRGSYAAIAHPVMISYLKQLGITAIELLPIQFHLDEPRLQKLNLTNYWGYNTLAPFAIEPTYWSGRANTSPLNEFRDMVKALHRAGIEVILDIVFNHTAELDLLGPTLSFRGIDNSTYYWLQDNGDYHNWTGCGNTLNLSHPMVKQWVIDCLHFWANECHVDGFRFDLATVLGRTPEFSSNSPLLRAITQDSVLSKLKLIAEPWDVGTGGYQLGNFPTPFAEWNDRFRDDIRQFTLNKGVSLGTFASRFAGSSDIYQQSQRLPYVSINKITSHDGFTLQDVVSFNHKHNQANGESNTDGSNSNHSNNHGFEGITDDPQILQKRSQSQRHLLTFLMLSLGTPMLLAGDEQGNSQQGNNNAYCQDSPVSWINWQTRDEELIQFTSRLTALRHKITALTEGEWWTGNFSSEKNAADVVWLNQHGEPLTPEQWQWHEILPLQILLSGKWLIIINFTEQNQHITFPAGHWVNSEPFLCSSEMIEKHQSNPRNIDVLTNNNFTH